MIHYVSTRGEAGRRGFKEVLLAGLAEDGGLFVPETWPRFAPGELDGLRGLPYAETATRVLLPFTGGCFEAAELRSLCEAAYAGFTHPATAPLKQLGPEDWLLELFHGPTLAFKDFAMQLLAGMFEAVLARERRSITIVGATSGDTGAAAVRAFAGKSGIRVVMLHPEGRISPVQRRQMTTDLSPNVLNIAVQGTFDDCQDLVKALFMDRAFREDVRLSGVNSINWARVAAQAAYYVYSALRLGAPARGIDFCVPTGNFGNVYAGWVARRMGLPIRRLHVATNGNDILARFVGTGLYERGQVVPTISPSMDIQVASNFERLLFELEGGSAERVRGLMAAFRQSGSLTPDPDAVAQSRAFLAGGSADEAETSRTIGEVWRRTGELVDPHTAVGLAVAARAVRERGVPLVTLATAHPGKFADAVAAAVGVEPRLPAAFADLLQAPERYITLPNDRAAVEAAIRNEVGKAA